MASGQQYRMTSQEEQGGKTMHDKEEIHKRATSFLTKEEEAKESASQFKHRADERHQQAADASLEAVQHYRQMAQENAIATLNAAQKRQQEAKEVVAEKAKETATRLNQAEEQALGSLDNAQKRYQEAKQSVTDSDRRQNAQGTTHDFVRQEPSFDMSGDVARDQPSFGRTGVRDQDISLGRDQQQSGAFGRTNQSHTGWNYAADKNIFDRTHGGGSEHLGEPESAHPLQGSAIYAADQNIYDRNQGFNHGQQHKEPKQGNQPSGITEDLKQGAEKRWESVKHGAQNVKEEAKEGLHKIKEGVKNTTTQGEKDKDKGDKDFFGKQEDKEESIRQGSDYVSQGDYFGKDEAFYDLENINEIAHQPALDNIGNLNEDVYQVSAVNVITGQDVARDTAGQAKHAAYDIEGDGGDALEGEEYYQVEHQKTQMQGEGGRFFEEEEPTLYTTSVKQGDASGTDAKETGGGGILQSVGQTMISAVGSAVKPIIGKRAEDQDSN